jgi:hypothetical protein
MSEQIKKHDYLSVLYDKFGSTAELVPPTEYETGFEPGIELEVDGQKFELKHTNNLIAHIKSRACESLVERVAAGLGVDVDTKPLEYTDEQKTVLTPLRRQWNSVSSFGYDRRTEGVDKYEKYFDAVKRNYPLLWSEVIEIAELNVLTAAYSQEKDIAAVQANIQSGKQDFLMHLLFCALSETAAEGALVDRQSVVKALCV